MSEFDITGADKTPQQRYQFGEALREARQREPKLNAADNPSPIASWAARQRAQARWETRRRAAILDLVTSTASVVLGTLGLITPNQLQATLYIGAAIIAAGILVGSLIRGAL